MNNYPIMDVKIAKKDKTIKKNLKETRKSFKGKENKKQVILGKLFQDCSLVKPSFSFTKTEASLFDVVRKADLRGMSGNGFPTIEKLDAMKAFEGKKTLIINAIECEPSLVHDSFLVDSYQSEIEEGIKLIQENLMLDKVILAKKGQAKQVLDHEGYQEVILPFIYPLGEEHVLIKKTLGMELDKALHPIEKGILVMNVQTVLWIYLLMHGVIERGRFLTIASIHQHQAKAIFVPYGESIKKVAKKNFPLSEETLYAGGGVLNGHLVEETETVTPEISLILYGKEENPSNALNCIGCGKCSKNCPSSIDLRSIVKLREKDPKASITDFGVDACIKCGLCTWNCPKKKVIGAYLK